MYNESFCVSMLPSFSLCEAVHLRREAERQEVIIGGHQPSAAAPGGGVGGPALKKKVKMTGAK